MQKGSSPRRKPEKKEAVSLSRRGKKRGRRPVSAGNQSGGREKGKEQPCPRRDRPKKENEVLRSPGEREKREGKRIHRGVGGRGKGLAYPLYLVVVRKRNFCREGEGGGERKRNLLFLLPGKGGENYSGTNKRFKGGERSIIACGEKKGKKKKKTCRLEARGKNVSALRHLEKARRRGRDPAFSKRRQKGEGGDAKRLEKCFRHGGKKSKGWAESQRFTARRKEGEGGKKGLPFKRGQIFFLK